MDKREQAASKYMIQCQNSKDFECPYLETCPHEDKDVCQWQLDQADQIIALLSEGEEPPMLTPREQTIALDKIPFADLRGQETRDVLCKAAIEKVKPWWAGREAKAVEEAKNQAKEEGYRAACLSHPGALDHDWLKGIVAKAVKQARAEAVEIIGDLTDADECSLDHHGNCQNHGYSMPCPMPKAKEYLAHYGQEG